MAHTGARIGVLISALSAVTTGCVGSLDAPAGSSECPTCAPGDGHGSVIGDDDQDPNDPAGAGDPSTPNGVGWSTRFAKLSNAQWENSVRDIFSFAGDTSYSQGFTQEPGDQGYRNQAAAELTLAGDAWTRYQTAAESVAAAVTANDQQLAKLLPAGTASDLPARKKALITSLGLRAFRRPLTDAEQTTYGGLFDKGPDLVGGDAYKAGARVVIEAILQSPHFLYRVEAAGLSGNFPDRKAPLSGYEIATRLSYGFLDTTPSTALLEAARKGELDSADGVAKWAQQLLADPRAKEALLSFHEQTYLVDRYGTQDKDPSLNFNAAALAPVLRDEARMFFEDVVINEKGGIGQLLTEPVAFVNETTAPLYGVSGVSGQALVRKELDAAVRAGFLTQVGFLSQNATRSLTDPVHRGLTVLRKVLCDEPDPPPMMFSLPDAEPGLTTRQVYEKATACGTTCHTTLINPPGFAFEGFDTLGRVRDTDQGKPVDTTGSLSIRSGYTSEAKGKNPSTTLKFDGPVDMLNKLASESRVHECYARNWMQYMLNREPTGVERGAWELLRGVSLDQDSAQDLLIALVKLDTFRTRVVE
ncbi:MAG: DUF1592 domain-containing protein [Myxococcales bacterium]